MSIRHPPKQGGGKGDVGNGPNCPMDGCEGKGVSRNTEQPEFYRCSECPASWGKWTEDVDEGMRWVTERRLERKAC